MKKFLIILILFAVRVYADGFNGVRCGPRHPKTGDIICCEYQDGVIISCTRR